MLTFYPRRWIIVLFSSLICLFSLEAEGFRIDLDSWRFTQGDEMAYAETSFDDSAWSPITLPRQVDTGGPSRIFWLRGSFSPNEDFPERICLFLDKGEVAVEAYVDGRYIGGRGQLAPNYELRTTQAKASLLPPLANDGKAVCIALRCCWSGSRAKLSPYALIDESTARKLVLTSNFWNADIYLMMTALCLFLGFYFLVQFGLKSSERENLYFALTLIFISLYLIDLGASSWPSGMPMLRALSRSGLCSSMMFLLPFFMAFLGRKRYRTVLAICLGLAAAFTCAFIAARGDETIIAAIFSISCLIIFIPIFISLVVSIKAIRAGVKEAWPILIAIILGIGLAGHDVYYQVIGRNPMAWLQGLAFFALDISIFIALSMRQARLKNALERYAGEINTRTAELDANLRQMAQAGNEAAMMAERFGGAVAGTERVAKAAAERSGRIEADATRQAEQARHADSLVLDLVVSVDRVTEKLTIQNEGAERSATAVGQLSAGAAAVAQSIAHTSKFTQSLTAMGQDGEAAATALVQAMERIEQASAGISEVAAAVEDFAQRTNMLAMNASIEAAHSGAAGKGFGIIAHEIKQLALRQSAHTARIKDIVAEINERVGEGIASVGELRLKLSQIAGDAKHTADRMEDVSRNVAEQTRAATDIGAAMEALALAIASIRQESEHQREYMHQLREAVADMAGKAGEVQAAAQSMAQDGQGLVGAVVELRDLAEISGKLTAKLAAQK